MSPRHLVRFWAIGSVAFVLAFGTLLLPAIADDADETTYDRNSEREWTDVDGNSTTGRFSGVIRDEVLINSGGRVNRVKLSSLSESDIAWLWGLHNQEGKLNQLPIEYRERPVVSEPEAMPDEPMPAEPMPYDPSTPEETTTPADPAMPATGSEPAADEESLDLRAERVWTVNGNPVRGRWSGLINSEILINADGRVQRIQLSELSEYDLAWLWDVYNAQGNLADLPIEYRERPQNPIRPEMTAPSEVAGSDVPEGTVANADELYSTETYRDWTDDPINARFMRFTTQDRLLVTDRGRMHTIPFDDLSQDDLAWLRGYHAHHGIDGELPDRLRPRGPNQPGAATIANLRDTRTWTDREGNTLQGSFSSIRTDQVSIHRGAGQGWIEVHLAQLAIGDLTWLQNALRNEGRIRELPLVFRDAPDNGQTEADLVRLRRHGGNRQWRLYNGQTFVGAFDRVEDGIVIVDEYEAEEREEHWNDLSDADHEYLKNRLARETPAEFFPAQTDLVASADDLAADRRVWTDRDGNQIVAKFKNLAAMNTVAVFDTADGEVRYIYEYISNDDQESIRGVTQQNQQTQIAQGGGRPGGGYSSTPPGFTAGPPGFSSGPPGFSSGPGPGMRGGPTAGHGGINNPGGSQPHMGGGIGTNPGGTGGASGIHHEPFDSGFHEPSIPDLPSYTGPQIPDIQVPTFEWVYKCDNCGAEFNESSGLKMGDPCPNCSRTRFPVSFPLRWMIIGGVVLVSFVIRKLSR